MLGSLASGIARSMAAGAERKERSEQRTLQKKMLELQMKSLQFKQSQQEMRNKFLMQFLGGGPSEMTGTPGEGTQNQGPQIAKRPEEVAGVSQSMHTGTGDVIDMMIEPGAAPPQAASAMQQAGVGGRQPMPQQGRIGQTIGQMNPQAVAALSELLGVDLLGAARLEETRRSNALRENQYISEDVNVPGVGTVRTYRPKYGAPPSLSMGRGGTPSAGGMPSKLMAPSKGNMPIEEQNLGFWIDPKNLNSPAYGVTPIQATKKGFVRVTSGDKSKINDFKGVQVLAKRIRAQAEKVYPKTGGVYDKYIGGTKRALGAMTEADPEARKLKDMIDGTIAAFVRMYEKGTLTDEDIGRAKRLHISLTNSAGVVWDKLDELDGLIADSQASFLGRNGYVKSGAKGAGKTKGSQAGNVDIKSIYNDLRNQGMTKQQAHEELKRRGLMK